MYAILNRHVAQSLLQLAAVAFLLGACSSIQGTKLVAGEDGNVTKKDIGGLPITVKIPKTAIFVITKTVYSVVEQTVIRDLAAGEITVVSGAPQQFSEVTFDKEPIILGPTETYAIDPKRPFYGTIDYEIELTEQYPSKFKGKVDDKTLEQVNQLIESMVSKLTGVPTVEKQAGEGIDTIRTVLSKEILLLIFDLQTGQYQLESV
jgi:alcohol dehydrogenase YqhD (iron-dependent ADH family)